MEIEPDFENMTINEYLKYEAEVKRRLTRNVQSKRSPTKYEKADFDSFYWNKSNTFNYSYSYGLLFPHPYLEDCLVSINDVDNINDLEKEEARVEVGDNGDICDIWDIIREFLTPDVPDVMDDLLEDFREEILNVTMVDEEANFNPTKDIEELERLLAKDPQSHFIEI
ncbi:hypothetical protein Tco_0544833 [Tanacetum coccineum]